MFYYCLNINSPQLFNEIFTVIDTNSFDKLIEYHDLCGQNELL